VGCVSGELRYRDGEKGVEGERVYWGYEQTIKRLESRVSSLGTTNGAIYAVRKSLYEPLQADTISDFIEPLKIVGKGYRVIYEPEAIAWETTAKDPKKEFRRRVRIVTRSVHSLLRDRSLLSLLNPVEYGMFSIQLWSHKVLRWFSGLFLLLIFVFNVPLLDQGLIYMIAMVTQAAFYLFALWGFLTEAVMKKQAPKIPHVAYYFLLSCCAMLKGVYDGLRGRTMVTWQPSR
jgi:cellulose synthase/poly-beta-1,6-N-acetylglucosamine synthase-like glycosyltransferase